MWVELLQLASWVQVYLGGLDGSKTCCLVGWAGLDRIDHMGHSRRLQCHMQRMPEQHAKQQQMQTYIQSKTT